MRSAALLLLVPLAACDKDDAPAPREPNGINVLVISLDSTRRDLLSAYGHRAPHAPDVPSSPAIDRLAAEGVLFEDAYATTSWTLSSHVALLSGQPDLVHGVDVDFHRVDEGHPMLQEVLRANGYATLGVFSGPYLEPVFGFARGFERYEQGYGPELARAMARRREATAAIVEAREAAPPGQEPRHIARLLAEERDRIKDTEQLSHEDRSSATVTDVALSMLDEAAAKKKPFFLFAHYFDPHYDYVPPAPFDAAFDPAYDGAIDGRNFWLNEQIGEVDPADPMKRIRKVSERDLEHVRALYAGELAWTDAQVGRLLARLDELGLAERTLVVLSADHGDEFFEHGSIGHRRTLHEEVLQVPLVMRLPGVLPAGKRVAGVVSNADVLPTVLELLGLADPPGLASRSLVPLARGAEAAHGGEAFGRLVLVREVDYFLPAEGGSDGAAVVRPGRHVSVIDTYRRGPIKITRERGWAKPVGKLSPAHLAFVEEQAREMRAQERLSWIDLEKNPTEPDARQRVDFDEPRAREALRAFHDRYVELVALRRGAGRSSGGEGVSGALAGLGYAGGDVSPEDVEDDELVLPPPGADLLRW
jgi:arylsulfatase A-like enzyme